jgi:hypothetical protein
VPVCSAKSRPEMSSTPTRWAGFGPVTGFIPLRKWAQFLCCFSAGLQTSAPRPDPRGPQGASGRRFGHYSPPSCWASPRWNCGANPRPRPFLSALSCRHQRWHHWVS